MGFIKRLKCKKGAALLWALIFLMIFSILGFSMLAMSSQDLREMTSQRDNLEAYYLAESGIDLAYAALMKKENETDVPLIESYINDTDKVYNQIITMGDDEIEIDIYSVEVDDKWWVKVVSLGRLNTGDSSKTAMRINVGLDNFVHIIREDE